MTDTQRTYILMSPYLVTAKLPQNHGNTPATQHSQKAANTVRHWPSELDRLMVNR